ncbi:Replication-relaxation [Gaiella occulta]|uniref:Replication-relaxation n=2 Tax=Gaiella occulta TaxID=1002870 RepID=A0A7M2YTP8_9ACTN|nr:Replication-relaxation [Gaiella occulta]
MGFPMSAHRGPQGLERLRTELSERDLIVLASVASHRFLTGRQIEAFHFSEHASSVTGSRVCRRVLARLVEQRLLVRLERRVGGVRAGSASYVYALGSAGNRLVSNPRGKRAEEPSRVFLDHTLAVADAHLALLQAADARRFELISVETEPAAWRRFLNSAGARETLRPDLYVVSAQGEFEHCWFLEIDNATESTPAVLRKCRQYQAYWRTGIEQQRSGTFPLVVWVTPNDRRCKQLAEAIASARKLQPEIFRAVASDELVELVAVGAA